MACNAVFVRVEEQLLHRNVQRFRGGLAFKAHRRLYHSTLGWRVIKKKKRILACNAVVVRVEEPSDLLGEVASSGNPLPPTPYTRE